MVYKPTFTSLGGTILQGIFWGHGIARSWGAPKLARSDWVTNFTHAGAMAGMADFNGPVDGDGCGLLPEQGAVVYSNRMYIAIVLHYDNNDVTLPIIFPKQYNAHNDQVFPTEIEQADEYCKASKFRDECCFNTVLAEQLMTM